MNPEGNHADAPDSWDQHDDGATGDADQVDQTAKILQGLNVDAPEFVPGQNVFAREFVPCSLQNSQPSDVGATSNSTATEAMEQNNTAVVDTAIETTDDWSTESGASTEPEKGSGVSEPNGAVVPMIYEDEDEEDIPAPRSRGTSESADGKKKDHINIVFIGHVDAGKSTIGGHIMYLTGMVDQRTLEKYEREAKSKNRESWYLSWALDTNQEERDKGKTVEVGRAYFETENKHFTILDAPGHKSFVPNMIGGASQADVAVLVISARKGEFETGFERGGQTREHAMLVKTAGVKQLIVVVNKMDDSTVEWDINRFQEIQEKLTPYLKKCGFNPKTDIVYIPVSGLTGAFLKDPPAGGACPWYSGPSLINYLDAIPSLSRMGEGPVRLPVVDRYKDMGIVVLGKVESGTIKKNQQLLLMPNKVVVEVMQLWSDDNDVEEVVPGENVKVKIKNLEEEDVIPGFVLCSVDNVCHTGKVFDVQIVILEHKSIICAGYSAVMHMHCCAEEVSIKALICLIDKKSGEKSKTRPRFIKQDQIAIVRLEVMGGAVCMEPFKDFPQMGRFTLRDEGKTIAIGKVLKVIN